MPNLTKPIPLACYECRQRHVKCDASQPSCERCLASRVECHYVTSQRGRRRGSRRGFPPDNVGGRNQKHTNSTLDRDSGLGETPGAAMADGISTSVRACTDGAPALTGHPEVLRSSEQMSENVQHLTQPRARAGPSCTSANLKGNAHLIGLYYTYFHPAHPILLPRNDPAWGQYPELLVLVVEFIGSHYCATTPSEPLRQSVEMCIAGGLANTQFVLQALLLYGIVSHARCDAEAAQERCCSAISLGKALGLNIPDYADRQPHLSPSMAESLRRTWWEMIVVDSLIAAFHHRPLMIVEEPDPDMPLPSDDLGELDEVTSTPRPVTLAAFADRYFSNESGDFPSAAYRIEAALILRQVLRVAGNQQADPDQIQSVDNCLASWMHHSPTQKRQALNASGSSDHMLFAGQIIIHCGVILLHLPRSTLASQCPVSFSELECGQKDLYMIPSSSPAAHAANAIAASQSISDMMAMRVPAQMYPPFVTCGLVLAAIVQIATGYSHSMKCLEQHRRRVVLILGVLKSLGEHFEVAEQASSRLKDLSARLFCLDKRNLPPNDIYSHGSDVDFSTIFTEFWLDSLVDTSSMET